VRGFPSRNRADAMGDDATPPYRGSIPEEPHPLALTPREERHCSMWQTRSCFHPTQKVHTESSVKLAVHTNPSSSVTRRLSSLSLLVLSWQSRKRRMRHPARQCPSYVGIGLGRGQHQPATRQLHIVCRSLRPGSARVRPPHQRHVTCGDVPRHLPPKFVGLGGIVLRDWRPLSGGIRPPDRDRRESMTDRRHGS
jgi:hypothetical protein